MSLKHRGILCLIIIIVLVLLLRQRSQNISKENSILVVPGGGLLTNGSLPSHTIARLEKAIELYTQERARNPSIITLSAGTPHKPNPLDDHSFPIFESSAAIKYLIHRGVPTNDILEEKLSLDTIGNVRQCLIFSLNAYSFSYSRLFFCEVCIQNQVIYAIL